MNEVKRYMSAIEHKLRMDRKTRARVMTDLASDFQNRRDAGQTDAEIMAELGTPAQAAAEFNAAFAAEDPAPGRAWGRPSRWRWLFLALAVLALLVNFAVLWFWRYMPFYESSPGGTLGIIGGADGPTAVFVTNAGTVSGLTGPWLFVAALCGFLLLGWCRADRKRLWLPILLSGVPLVLLAVRFVATLLLLPKAGELRRQLLASLALSPSTWAMALLAAVLVWAVWLYRRSGRK